MVKWKLRSRFIRFWIKVEEIWGKNEHALDRRIEQFHPFSMLANYSTLKIIPHISTLKQRWFDSLRFLIHRETRSANDDWITVYSISPGERGIRGRKVCRKRGNPSASKRRRAKPCLGVERNTVLEKLLRPISTWRGALLVEKSLDMINRMRNPSPDYRDRVRDVAIGLESTLRWKKKEIRKLLTSVRADSARITRRSASTSD